MSEENKTNIEKNELDLITKILKDNNVKIDDDKKGDVMAPFNKVYYSTSLRLSKLPKNSSLILSRIHYELISPQGVFHDTEENRAIIKDGTGYSSSMVNKGIASLKTPLKFLNNQPALIKIIQKTATDRVLKDRYMINPFLYNFSNDNETRKRQIFVTISFIEDEQDFDVTSIKQVDIKTQEVIMDTEDFSFDVKKAFEKLKEKDPFKWSGFERLE